MSDDLAWGMPSYSALGGMRIDANGRVTFDFEGRVHATGLDLDASTVVEPPDSSKIRWLSPQIAPGETMATLTAREGVINDVTLSVLNPQTGESLSLRLSVNQLTGQKFASIFDEAGTQVSLFP